MLLLMYSTIGSLLRCTVQPAAERSAEASDSSKACSTFRSGRPSISRMRPEKMFFLPALATVSAPALMAYRGMACTRSRRRSEEHTSELQSLTNLVCRLLLEKKNNEYTV